MTRRQFWAGVACLYTIGIAAALIILSDQQKMPADATGMLTPLAVPLVWGTGPIGLALVWLVLKRWDLAAARFGLLVFVALYLAIVGIRLWWSDLF